MRREVRVASAVVLALACGSERERLYGPEDNPTAVRDVTGVEFGWSCDEQACSVTQLPATPPPNACSDPTAAGYSYSWARFVEICSICVIRDQPGAYWSTTPGECRILACESDADCPAIYERVPESAYVCVSGLCQNADTDRFPREVLNRTEVEDLCFAPHPRADTADSFSPATQEVLETIQAACPGTAFDDPCTLPAGCRMP